ncbi:restriction endonuclease fold toxin-2 domain-containing protein [Streptomyces sp. NPDC004285]
MPSAPLDRGFRTCGGSWGWTSRPSSAPLGLGPQSPSANGQKWDCSRERALTRVLRPGQSESPIGRRGGANQAYQIRLVGSTECHAAVGGTQVWVEGLDINDSELLDAKYVAAPGQTPFAPGGKVPGNRSPPPSG